MTREEILNNCEFYSNELQMYAVSHGEAMNAMQIYVDQQTEHLQARIQELEEINIDLRDEIYRLHKDIRSF